MAKITALIHTHNDAQRIGRALESLRACDELLVIDHGSTDETGKKAREHGAEVKEGVPGVNRGVYAIDAHHDWVLCLLANESASEAMEASLFEWKNRNDHDSEHFPKGFSFPVREETPSGWQELGAHTRLVNRKKVNWEGELPADDPQAQALAGHVLRFRNP